jgi:hypothetical protein
MVVHCQGWLIDSFEECRLMIANGQLSVVSLNCNDCYHYKKAVKAWTQIWKGWLQNDFMLRWVCVESDVIVDMYKRADEQRKKELDRLLLRQSNRNKET